MEMPFNMEGYTCKELEDIATVIYGEATKRKTAAKKGEWNVVKNAIESWVEKYGNITVEITNREAEYEAYTSFDDEPGKIIMELW